MASYLLKYIQESKNIDNGPPARYELLLQRTTLDIDRDREAKLRRFTLGKRNPLSPHRTLLLVGASGSGKSTLINALVNYVMGVSFEDKVWFEIITDEKDRPQADSQTSAVTVYDIFGFEGKMLPYSLSIIDTPGYGDTRGIERDQMVTKTIEDLFTVSGGVDIIDAVGLVLKATENRLDDRMAYVFNSITSLFGKDMEKNIVAMMTHSTGDIPRNALQALEEAKISFAKENNEPVYFQFNNRQKVRIEGSRNERNAKHAFEDANEEMKNFSEFLEKTKSQSLKSTVQVLRERERLTACIQNTKEQVVTIEEKEKAIIHNRAELAKLGTLTTENESIMVTIKTHYKEKEKINHWWDYKATTCNKCQQNCHYPGCTMAASPYWCEIMRKRHCTSCKGRCFDGDHVRENWKWVDKTRSEKQPASKLMNLEKEKHDLEEEKKKVLHEAFQHIMKLEEIALNKNAVSTYQHLEFLSEKLTEIGDTEKVKKLEDMRNRMDNRNKAGANYFMKYFQK